jgi:hypothetical protein
MKTLEVIVRPRLLRSIILFGIPVMSLLSGSPRQDFPAISKAGETGERPASAGPQDTRVKAGVDYGRLPLYFIPNRGQEDPQVSYYVHGNDKSLYFTRAGITFVLSSPGQRHNLRASEVSSASRTCVVKLDFIGADPDIVPVADSETGAIVSYFRGKREDWHAGLPTYSRIVYPGLWPGIDLVYSGTANHLKYEFIVHPGADPAKIRLAYRGADNVSVDGQGRLVVSTAAGRFEDDTPVAYQDREGKKIRVPLAYRLGEEQNARAENGEAGGSPAPQPAGGGAGDGVYEYGFDVGAYDRSLPLVLDPAILLYCGYIGGTYNDNAVAIAVDRSGSAYITGDTSNTETSFPVVVGPDLTHNGNVVAPEAFVAKIDPAGTGLVYCGYIGGLGYDNGCGIAVDETGAAYVVGATSSTPADGFPVTMGPGLIKSGTHWDAFVAKVRPDGTGLVYCGYIGGSDLDKGRGIAVDAAGQAYVTGLTYSNEATFPLIAGPRLIYNGGEDGFVAKIKADGTGFDYCGYVGSLTTGIAVDKFGQAYVTGCSYSVGGTFPVVVGPDLTYNGNGDAFVAKIKADGTGTVYCGYLGGTDFDYPNGIAVDGAGNAYIAGITGSSEAGFPVLAGPDLTFNGPSRDGFVAKVNAAGTALVYCGYLGGSPYEDSVHGIAVDGSGSAYVTGATLNDQRTFPVVAGPDLTFNGVGAYGDAFVAKVNAAGTGLDYCGYIGGLWEDYGNGIAVDGSGRAYIAGVTESVPHSFPTVVGPDLTPNGLGDGFAAKIYSYDKPVHRHAVGDFDSDKADEVAMDFGASGAWLYNGGAWSQITTIDPENSISFDGDGDGDRELALDLGSWGVWMWKGGVWSPLTLTDPEYMIAADTDGNGRDDLILDRAAQGLWWRKEGGAEILISPLDAQNIIAADVDGDASQQVAGDFGLTGMWIWDNGNWSELSAFDAQALARTDVDGDGRDELAAGLGSPGMWLYGDGAWGQLTGGSPDKILSGRISSGWGDEIVGDFGVLGLWAWQSGAWNQLSAENAEELIVADTDGDGLDEVAADLATMGLWLWNGGMWVHLTGDNPEGLISGDLDGDGAAELVVDFGPAGVWLWEDGVWARISSANPE